MENPQDTLDGASGAGPAVMPPLPVPANSPISAETREAITWARQNGVLEMDLPVGRFVLHPMAPPSVFDPAEKFGKKAPMAPGGFEKDILFASSPKPYDPAEDKRPDETEEGN